MRVLHVAAEVFPLVKPGGLADWWALPQALVRQGADVRLCCPLPGHRRRCCTRRPVSSSGLVRRRAHPLRLATMPQPRAGCLCGRRALAVPAAAAPTRRPMAASGRQPAALRPAGLDGGAPGRRRARPGWQPSAACARLARRRPVRTRRPTQRGAPRYSRCTTRLPGPVPRTDFCAAGPAAGSCSRTAWSTTASSSA